MKALALPVQLRGTVVPPPSKSQAHRMIIAAALSPGVSRINGVELSDDIRATLSCIKSLGSDYTVHERDALVDLEICGTSPDHTKPLPECLCNESGSTLRFMIPIALVLRGGGIFRGQGRLLERPLGPYFAIFEKQGIKYAYENGALTVQGTLSPGMFMLSGDVSSQFLTGLLYALSLLEETSTITLTSPLESRGYVAMTTETLAQYGILVDRDEWSSFTIRGGQRYIAKDAEVEKDYSQAAFFYAALGIGNSVSIRGLNPHSAQGDRIIQRISARLSDPGHTYIDVSQCPDLVPAIAVQAALRDGEKTRIINAARVRLKESDRLAATTEELNRLGAKITEHAEELTITGVASFSGGDVQAHNDHRIAMMLAIAATRSKGALCICGAESVNKSYPSFWKEYSRLGGAVRLLDEPSLELRS